VIKTIDFFLRDFVLPIRRHKAIDANKKLKIANVVNARISTAFIFQ
jgi:hypothetical protein